MPTLARKLTPNCFLQSMEIRVPDQENSLPELEDLVAPVVVVMIMIILTITIYWHVITKEYN